jgi:hypothetical protein
MTVIKVKDNPGLVKDKETTAILSVDNDGLKAYKLQRERLRQNNGMLDDINNIKQELIELRGILKQISLKL